jgi:hypothetical protein
MAVPDSTFSRRALTSQVKEQHALDLRLAGHTYEVIAVRLGYASRSSAYRAVGRPFHRIRAHTDQTADQLRQLEDARYDRMLRADDDKIQRGDLAAIDRALRISKARRELWGLDAPVQIQAEVSPALAALLQQRLPTREYSSRGKAGSMMGCPGTVVGVMPRTCRASSGMGISGSIGVASQMAIFGLIFASRVSKDP